MTSTFLRPVPGTSPIHRLWAGTKILAALSISFLLMLFPNWPILGIITVFLLIVMVVARIPVGVLPRLPWWLWGLVVLGAALNAPVGTAAVLRYAQVLVFGLILVTASLLITWTTPMSDIAPAFATLGRPLRLVRVPVDELAVVVALTMRVLPLLVEEMRLLAAARRLRPKPHWLARSTDPVIDLLTAALAVTTRRAGELGEAITARGGTGQLTARPASPTRRDAVALSALFAVCVGAVTLQIML